jgi:acetolactate synthase-1/2/3 large subunit
VSRSGAQILVDSLLEGGVDVAFGFPGGQVLPLFDVLYDSALKLILVRHEQAAAHAADGYARVTGKVGVCIATSGPGATNLVTGIATACADSVPLVAITGQVKTHVIGSDAFQEADITGITRPITKHNYLVREVGEIARVVKEALHIASTGRPGPVLIDLPVDVSQARCDDGAPSEIHLPGYRPVLDGSPHQVALAAEAINAAERPVIYAGGGVIISGCHAELKRLAETARIPVTTTLLGLGGFDERHPLALKMLGMHGTAYANYAVAEADCLIAIGARFDDRVTGKIAAFAPHAKIVHIDVDPASISKTVTVDVPVIGDARRILTELNKQIVPRDRAPWLARVDEWKRKFALVYSKNGGRIKPQYVVEQICEATNGEAIITTEVGQNQMWAALYFTYRHPRRFVSSGGLGTMGYGFPAAIGAQVGRPDAVVFDVAGDGSIQMNIQELATAVQHRLPVKIAILNNGFLGMVRQWQELFYHRRYSHTKMLNPDFAKVAEAYGAVGITVEKPEDVRPAIDRAIATPNCVVLDFRVEPEENVYPMVPPGEAVDRMIGGMA